MAERVAGWSARHRKIAVAGRLLLMITFRSVAIPALRAGA